MSSINKANILSIEQIAGIFVSDSKILEGCHNIKELTIKCINEGTLVIQFIGNEEKSDSGRIPILTDYLSIKVNGKELLDSQVTVSFENRYIYKTKCHDGQVFKISLKPKYHFISETALTDLLYQLGILDRFRKKLTPYIYRQIK